MQIQKLITALENIKESYPDAEIAIDSDGCLSQDFEITINDLDDNKAVIFIPNADSYSHNPVTEVTDASETILSECHMTEQMYEKLKRAVFDAGADAVVDLLGHELDFESDTQMSDAMDEALFQMPDTEALRLYEKYCRR